MTASASEVGIASPVTLRVGPARTGELMGPCGNCGPNAEPEDVVPLVSWVETSGCTDVETVSSWSCWKSTVQRVSCPCSKSDSTQWCQ